MKTPFKNNYRSQIERTATEAGESIEELLRRMTANKEPIPQNVPPIYTEKKEGVIPDYDVRADRFDVAMQAQDKYAASEIAKGAEKGEGAEQGEGAEVKPANKE